MKLPIRLLAAALPLLLAACVHKEAVRPQPKADYAVLLNEQRAREHLLATTDHWVLQGKIGVSGQVNGKKDGGSGTLTWTQNGQTYDFVVRGPVGSKSFKLTVTPEGATLEGLEGGPQRSPVVESLVQNTLGWQVPFRNLRAGAIVGSGTVSNKDAKRGYCCIAEKRCLETIEDGSAHTEFMKFGDTVKIEMFDEAGKSIFGSIDQAVAPLEGGL